MQSSGAGDWYGFQLLTQLNVAVQADISQSFLSDIENGRKSPTLRSLGLIAKVFDVSIKDLIS